MAKILISRDGRKGCYSCLKFSRPPDEHDRAGCREGVAFLFRLESQQLRTGNRHQSFNEFTDACPDGRSPGNLDPTAFCPFLSLTLDQEQHLRGYILIEGGDMP